MVSASSCGRGPRLPLSGPALAPRGPWSRSWRHAAVRRVVSPPHRLSMRRETHGLRDGLEQTSFIGLAGARDIEGGAMIDRSSNHRQADGDIDAALDPHHLDRAMALVVVHGHHQIEVAALRPKEQRVGGERTGHVEAVLAELLDRRGDLLLLLAVAEQAIFPSVRIDAAHPDARGTNAGLQ